MSNLIRDFCLMIINLDPIKFSIPVHDTNYKKEININSGRKGILKYILLL